MNELSTISVPPDPQEVIARSTGIANELRNLIQERRLYTSIKGKRYVHASGWQAAGAMMGIVAREVSCDRNDDGSYVAVVELVRLSDGAVVGRASASCGPDEVDSKGQPTWGDRPEYARRAMAATRAMSRAFRLSCGWILNLAGYEATSEAEMPEPSNTEDTPKPPPDKKGDGAKTVTVDGRFEQRTDEPASESQIQRIKELAKRANLKPDMLREYIYTEYSADKLSDITAAQAEHLIGWCDLQADIPY